MPQGSQVFGYGTTTKTAALKAFAKPNKKHLLGLGLKIFKGIGAELPQDFLEELYLFAPPDPTDDQNDEIYRTDAEKWQAVLNEIIRVHSSGQPLLVGTTNIKTSEIISK